jgi:hypothetical protein
MNYICPLNDEIVGDSCSHRDMGYCKKEHQTCGAYPIPCSKLEGEECGDSGCECDGFGNCWVSE